MRIKRDEFAAILQTPYTVDANRLCVVKCHGYQTVCIYAV